MPVIEPQTNHDREEQRPFGGCSNLLEHYQTIGEALLSYEKSEADYSAYKEFRTSVAFVPVEVLESYLDDVLDLSLEDENLYIAVERSVLKVFPFIVLGIVASMVLGVYLASVDVSLWICALVTLCLSFACLIFWHFSPGFGARRRINFAKVLSQEIARRRGHGGDLGSKAPRSVLFEKLLTVKASGSTSGAACDLVS